MHLGHSYRPPRRLLPKTLEGGRPLRIGTDHGVEVTKVRMGNGFWVGVWLLMPLRSVLCVRMEPRCKHPERMDNSPGSAMTRPFPTRDSFPNLSTSSHLPNRLCLVRL